MNGKNRDYYDRWDSHHECEDVTIVSCNITLFTFQGRFLRHAWHYGQVVIPIMLHTRFTKPILFSPTMLSASNCSLILPKVY